MANEKKPTKVRVGRDVDGRIVLGLTEEPPFYTFAVEEASMLALTLLQHCFAVYAGRKQVDAAADEQPPNIIIPRLKTPPGLS